MKKLFVSLTMVCLLAVPLTVNAGVAAEGYGYVKFEDCQEDNDLLDDINYVPEYCIHIYPASLTDGKFYYTLPKEARDDSGQYSADSYINDIDQFKDGNKVEFKVPITGGPNSYRLSDTDIDGYIRYYSSENREDFYEEFFDANFTAKRYNNSMYFDWDKYTEDNFLYYKLVYSLEKDNPVYPTSSTLKYYENSNRTSLALDYTLDADFNYALCVVTTDQQIDCTDGQKATYVNSDIGIIPVNITKIEIPPAGFEDEVITTFDQYENPFPDTDLNDLAGRAAAELYRRAVLGGYPDGEFKGEREVNRAEAAKFLLFARLGDTFEEHENEDGGFLDVLKGEWYARFVVEAATRGIINGYPDGLFKPAKEVNTVEFLKMLTLTFGLETDLPYSQVDVEQGAWYEQYAGIVDAYDLFPHWNESYLYPSNDLSRTDVAIAIYQYLQNR